MLHPKLNAQRGFLDLVVCGWQCISCAPKICLSLNFAVYFLFFMMFWLPRVLISISPNPKSRKSACQFAIHSSHFPCKNTAGPNCHFLGMPLSVHEHNKECAHSLLRRTVPMFSATESSWLRYRLQWANGCICSIRLLRGGPGGWCCLQPII